MTSVSNQVSHQLNSVEFMTHFIKLYRSLPALWKVRSTDYSNKYKKEEGYQKLAELTKTLYKDANVEFVKCKINTFRGCFRKELKKVQASKRSGASPDDVYVPKLWYYELLSFAFEQEQPMQSTSNVPEDCKSAVSDLGGNDSESIGLQDEDEPVNTKHLARLAPPQNLPMRRNKRGATTKAVSHNAKELLLAKAEKALDRDELDAYFENVAAKMRRMSERQCLFVEKIINEAVFLGVLKRLTEYSHVDTPDTRFPNYNQEMYSGQDNYSQDIATYQFTSQCVTSPSPSSESGTSVNEG